MEDTDSVSKARRIYCPHCSEFVSKSTFYHHKSLYYWQEKGTWSKGRAVGYDPVSPDSESDIDQDSDACGSTPNLEFSAEDDFCAKQGETNLDPESSSEDTSDSEVSDVSVDAWESESDMESDVEAPASSDSSTAFAVCHAITAFIMMWQYRFSLSNNAISALLAFMRLMFVMVNKAVKSPILDAIVACLPNGVEMCRRLLKSDHQQFVKYACCTKCCKVYPLEYCIEKVGSKTSSKCCPFVAYPDHPLEAFRQRCGAQLMKGVKIQSKLFMYPFKTFCYKSITESLRQLCDRTGFLDKCDQWRQRKVHPNVLCDVYDGQIWKNFEPFLVQPHSLGLMLNVDWFQPFSHTQYSVGVVYLAVMNLPRSERFLPENIIICSVIPGPSEPKQNINSFMMDMVKELKELWTGVFLSLSVSPLPVRLRAALLCVAADIPATRKACGFTSHNSSRGCSKCLKKFDITVGKHSDYSGYDRQNWELRTNMHHRESSKRSLSANTKSNRAAIEKETGVRHSILNELHYFDCVRFHVIDPMHNLLLGTGKHLMHIWIQRGLITNKDFDKIQKEVDSFTVPSDIGRIPFKISSGFASFKADQWRSWIVVYSAIVLKEVLPMEDYALLSLFIKACTLLCTRSISHSDLNTADSLLLEFCSRFSQMYGGENTTMNMHLHCHLKTTVLDYGPVYAYWLFSFERFNGILGSICTNNRAIEPQLMKRFLCDQQLQSDSIKKTLEGHGMLQVLSTRNVVKGSVAKQISPCDKLYHPVGPITEESFDKEDCDDITQLLSQNIPSNMGIQCLRVYHKFKAITDGQCIIGSLSSRRIKSTNVFAIKDGSVRVCQIQYFCEVQVSLESEENTKYKLAFVRWYQRHPEQNWFAEPALVYCKFFDPCSTFIKLEDIQCIAATCIKSVTFPFGNESVLCAIPLERYSHTM